MTGVCYSNSVDETKACYEVYRVLSVVHMQATKYTKRNLSDSRRHQLYRQPVFVQGHQPLGFRIGSDTDRIYY